MNSLEVVVGVMSVIEIQKPMAQRANGCPLKASHMGVFWPLLDSKMVELRLEDGRSSTRRLTLVDHLS